MPATEPCSAGTVADDLTLRELGPSCTRNCSNWTTASHTASALLLEGKTRDEAAEQIGMTSGAFKKRLERARRLLGNRLTRRGLVPSVALLATLFSESGARAAVSQPLDPAHRRGGRERLRQGNKPPPQRLPRRLR